MISMTKTRKKIKVLANRNIDALTHNVNTWVKSNNVYPDDFKLAICSSEKSNADNIAVCMVIYSEEVNDNGGE